MGRPKLLLPWRRQRVIDGLLNAWTQSNVDQVVVIVRKDDDELAEACASYPVRLVRPHHDPVDMKQSIQIGIRSIASHDAPASIDRCFVAPADLPALSSELINGLIDADAGEQQLVVPRFGDRQGHPVLMPWPIMDEVFDLPEGAGIDRIVERHQKFIVEFSPHQHVRDIDTPEEYRALRDSLANRDDHV